MLQFIRKTLLLLLLGTVGIPLCAQVQIGETIRSSEDNFAFGQNVQLSENGKRLVVSGYGKSDKGVALFENRNGIWVEQAFMGASNLSDSLAIYSVAMSSDGNKIAVGSVVNNFQKNTGNVKVFHFDNNTWAQKGNTIISESKNELFGRSIGISDDGTRVIVGARLNSEFSELGGRVAMYEYDNGDWSQLGQSIKGYKEGVKIGSSVAISGDGTNVFVGSNSNYSASNTTDVFIGLTETHQLINNNWVHKDIRKGFKNDHFGYSVAISNNGEIFAAGATQFGNKNGYVKVYQNNEGVLEIIGVIKGAINEYLGSDIALSADGKRIVVGAVHSGNSGLKGAATIYEYNGRSYIQIGKIIDSNNNPKFGVSVAMSANGTTIAVGALAYNYDLPGTEQGFVNIYDISDLEIPDTNSGSEDSIIVYPSPATNVLYCIKCDAVSELYIIDVTGKIVVSLQGEFSNAIDVSMLQSGIYYVYYVEGDDDFKVRKFSKK